MNDKRFNKLNSKTYTFDFAGRKVVDDKSLASGKDYKNEIDEILKDSEQSRTLESHSNQVFNQDVGDITLTVSLFYLFGFT